MADRLADRLGHDDSRIHVVHNGVDLDRFHPGDVSIADRPPVILAASIATPEKGLHHLIAALPHLLTPRWQLWIAGDGWYHSAVTPPEQSGPVRRLGFLPRSEMPDFLRSGRVFVYPSDWDEPFGLGLVEAMASGLPCVTTRRGGIPEAGGSAVAYIDPTDAAALAAAIDSILQDDAQAKELGESGRAQAALFSTAHQYDSFCQAVQRTGRV
jgi:glycosyltransferase involved in cell wall biosynthesis